MTRRLSYLTLRDHGKLQFSLKPMLVDRPAIWLSVLSTRNALQVASRYFAEDSTLVEGLACTIKHAELLRVAKQENVLEHLHLKPSFRRTSDGQGARPGSSQLLTSEGSSPKRPGSLAVSDRASKILHATRRAWRWRVLRRADLRTVLSWSCPLQSSRGLGVSSREKKPLAVGVASRPSGLTISRSRAGRPVSRFGMPAPAAAARAAAGRPGRQAPGGVACQEARGGSELARGAGGAGVASGAARRGAEAAQRSTGSAQNSPMY